MPAPNAASTLKKVRDMLAFLLNVSCRLFDLLLRDAVGRGNLAFRDNLGVAPASRPERQRDQQEKDDQRGPLGLFESPVEGEERDDDIRAYKEDQKLGDGITKQIGDHEHARATIASGQEKEHYDQDEIEKHLIPSRRLYRNVAGASRRVQAGPTVGIVIDRGPGKLAREADDIPVDQIANTPKGLSKGREERAGIEHDQRIEPFFDRPPEQHWHDQKDRAEKSHSALPGCQNILGLQQVILHQIGLLDDEIEAPAHEASHDAPPNHPVDLVPSYALAYGIPADQPEAHHNGHDVHQAIPVQCQWANVQDHRVHIQVNIWADL